MPENPQNPAPAPGATAAKRPRSAQDKIIEADIADSKQFLSVASTDTEIRAILEAHGYDAAEFAQGTQLAAAASAAFTGRATGMGQQKLSGDELAAASKAARHDYAAFRDVARAAFPADAGRTGLSLRGEVPDDTGRFITLAEASYTAAGQDPYKTKLTKRGYPATRLTTLLEQLDDLTATGGDQDEALGDAMEDTTARDTAYNALKAYMKELKGTARGALRGKNGLLAKLGM
jgi:hypothetical protein